MDLSYNYENFSYAMQIQVKTANPKCFGPESVAGQSSGTRIGHPWCILNHSSLVPALRRHALVEQRGTTRLIAVVGSKHPTWASEW